MTVLVHLPLVSDWEAFCDDRFYRPPSLAAEGFLPLCTRDLAPVVANTVMIGGGNRLIVAVDPGRLSAELRREAVGEGTYAWPHVYGPLDLDAVPATAPYPTLPSGRFGPVPDAVRDADDGPDYDGEVTGVLAVEVIQALESADLWAVVDGGWGIDALLRRQTRAHGDLDLCVRADQLDQVMAVLEALSFHVTADQRPTRLEVRRSDAASADLHPLVVDAFGSGTEVLPDGSMFRYPAEGLAGTGTIAGHAVSCLTAGLQVSCHTGYEPGDNSYWNMSVLRQAFGVELPPPYDEALASVGSSDGVPG